MTEEKFNEYELKRWREELAALSPSQREGIIEKLNLTKKTQNIYYVPMEKEKKP